MSLLDKHEQQSDPAKRDSYEPPRIETVLTADELAREVLYAGATISNPPSGPPT